MKLILVVTANIVICTTVRLALYSFVNRRILICFYVDTILDGDFISILISSYRYTALALDYLVSNAKAVRRQKIK